MEKIIPDKEAVKAYWDENPCIVGKVDCARYSREYFDAIEKNRYETEPEIFSFAQFSRYSGKKVLEVGVGTGTDFIQWVRSGAEAYGVDLSATSVEHTLKRLKVYGLSAKEVRSADAENLPYPEGFFDLAYSWGVIHHSPDTGKALSELIRVTKAGGRIKVMVYNRRAIGDFLKYLQFGLFRLRPFQGISRILYNRQESIGTKAYTLAEIRKILSGFPVRIVEMRTYITKYELFPQKPFYVRFAVYLMAIMLNFHNAGWFLVFDLEKQR